MRILVTGGFGNVGTTVVNECLKRGHRMTVFEVQNHRNETTARQLRSRGIRAILGDLRRPDEVVSAAVLPTSVNHRSLASMTKLIFDLDVAHALVTAAERLVDSPALAGTVGFVGGGRKQGCQLTTRELVTLLFTSVGLRSLDESLFSPTLNSYYLDWHDTEEIESLLHFQRHSVQEWQTMTMSMIPCLRGGITAWLERQSPRRHNAATTGGG